MNIVFVAGTGVLPFMDLIGFIARTTLDCLEHDSGTIALSSSFKLHLIAKFRSEEKIGDKLMKALTQANPTQFDYEMTDDSSNEHLKWTEATIGQKLQECSEK